MSYLILLVIVMVYEDGYFWFYDVKFCEWYVFILLGWDMFNNCNSIYYFDVYSFCLFCIYNFFCFIIFIFNVYIYVVCWLYCLFVGFDKEDFNLGIGRV